MTLLLIDDSTPQIIPQPETGILTAFRQQKTLEEWTLDPRCRVSLEELGWRLCQGWTPEDAILVPHGETPPPARKRRWEPQPNSEPFPEMIPASSSSFAPVWIIRKSDQPSPAKPTRIQGMQESARAKAQPTASSGPSLEPSLVVQSDALIYVVDLIHCRDLLPYELLLLTNLRNHCYEKAIGVSILAAGNGAHMALLESMGIDQLITVRSSLLEAIQAAREDRQRILQGEVPVSSIRWLIANDY